jgi:GrpB-like predicted nucleotidyltransferase (UPF0157 family)
VIVDVDEPVEVVDYDPRWPVWYGADAAELARALGSRLRGAEHFGSSAVPGLAAKPIVDILAASLEWPLTDEDRKVLEGLGYQYLGEAGVPGREYLRRRGQHATNLAVVESGGSLWRDNLVLRDYLRCHPNVAFSYGNRKKELWARGARRLLAYSAQKTPEVVALLDAAKKWRSG